jgi:serine/threonine protein kinase
LPIGTVIGGYRLDSVLGTGGMGAVYRATHLRLKRRAAVKVLSEALTGDPTYVSRFFQEARVVNEVGHPNIIDIVDFIEGEGLPKRVAYVMELVEGPPLAKVLANQPLTTRQTLNITLQLLDALSAVHRINVVHRDLKPDNILVVGSLDTDLSARPAIKVLDFGIAKVTDPSASHRTNTGMMLGTPAYMAPEQAAGESVSPGTDIYAVGELLYEMLAGERLFTGQNMKILRAKVQETPPAVHLPSETPFRERLAAAISACIVPEQTHRPSIEELSAEIRAILALVSPANEHRAHAARPAPRFTPEQAPSLYQQTLVPPAHSEIAPREAKSRLFAWAGIALMVIACGVLGAVVYQRQTAPVMLTFPEPKRAVLTEPRDAPKERAPEAETEAQIEALKAEPVQPLVEEPEPKKEQTDSPKKRPARVKDKDDEVDEGPLKKGEFPSW